MRTTLTLDDVIARELKKRAVETGTRAPRSVGRHLDLRTPICADTWICDASP
jgi:hypothetical protein